MARKFKVQQDSSGIFIRRDKRIFRPETKDHESSPHFHVTILKIKGDEAYCERIYSDGIMPVWYEVSSTNNGVFLPWRDEKMTHSPLLQPENFFKSLVGF
jgi:hypothetical protein